MGTYLLNYDLHLIRNYLKEKGVRDYNPETIPIPANAPDHFRVYFATPDGYIGVGIENPPADKVLFIIANAQGRSGDGYIFLLMDAHIIDVLRPQSGGMALALSAFVGSNVLLRDFQREFSRTLSLWREELAKTSSPLSSASYEDILNFLYTDKS